MLASPLPQQPRLMFFCELGPDAATKLFARPDVPSLLAREGYGVVLALPDRSPQSAAVVRQLNAAGITVVAWLLLPCEHGYWLSLQNYPHALAAYASFREWVAREGLRFEGVGLDLQPAAGDMDAHGSMRALVQRLWRSRRNALFPAASSAYIDLVANIRHDGFTVYAYQLPVIIDDRRAGTQVLQRIFDIVDLPVDEEVLLCYRNPLLQRLFQRDLGGALVQSYGVHADGIAIGMTETGADPSLSEQTTARAWSAFSRDLRIAASFTPTVHIWSLEGCVQRGWLERLPTVDWQTVPPVALRDRMTIALMRGSLGVALWWSRAGVALLGWLGWLVAAWLAWHARPAWLRRRQVVD